VEIRYPQIFQLPQSAKTFKAGIFLIIISYFFKHFVNANPKTKIFCPYLSFIYDGNNQNKGCKSLAGSIISFKIFSEQITEISRLMMKSFEIEF